MGRLCSVIRGSSYGRPTARTCLSCDVSVTVLESSQTRDDAQSSAGATAVPKPLQWSSVLMWAVWGNVTAWTERRNNLASHTLSAAVSTSWIFESSDSAESRQWVGGCKPALLTWPCPTHKAAVCRNADGVGKQLAHRRLKKNRLSVHLIITTLALCSKPTVPN